MPDIDEVLPKYLRISGHIREQIEQGQLAPGAEVPSERELATRWKVARPTAAKALNLLRQQGIVESRRGSGTYVVDRANPVLRERPPRYGDGADESSSVSEARIVAGPVYVTDALGLTEGSAVIMRRHGSATELATAWFPDTLAERAHRLLRVDPISGGLDAYLESVTGQRLRDPHDQVCARLATPEELRYFELLCPAAVLVRYRTVRGADGAVVRFDEVIHPPGHRLTRDKD